MFAEMIDKIVSLKETKIFEIDGQTYSDANLTRIPPHVDRPDSVSVSGLDAVCKLVRTEIAKVGTTIMVHVRDYNKVEVMTTYLPDFSRNVLYRAQALRSTQSLMCGRGLNCSRSARSLRSRSRKANSSCGWTARKASPFSRRMAASGVWKRNATSLSISSAA